MSWNKPGFFSGHLSLKSRIALSYALLFFLSCAIIFQLMSYLIAGHLDRSADATLRRIGEETEMIYIMGPRFDRYGEILPGKEYPAHAKAALERVFPGAVVCYVNRVTAPDGDRAHRIYDTAYACYRGSFYEMRVQTGGQIYSRQLHLENHQARLLRYFMQQLYARGQDHFYLGIFNADGTPFLTTDMLDEQSDEAEDRQNGEEKAVVRTMRETGGEKEFRFMEFTLPDGRKILSGLGMRQQARERMNDSLLFFGLLSLVTLAGMMVGWLISRRFIRGIQRTTLVMNRISSGDYSYRIRAIAAGDREIRELMETFNAMNARTEALLRELKMVSDDVAHDLRTPLTRIAGTVEMLLCDRTLDENVRTACISVAEETNRMRVLINTMMEIARTNANPGGLHRERLDLAAMLRDLGELMQPAVEAKNLTLKLDLPADSVWIEADKAGLQRVFSNLLENALKFTEQGWIGVALQVTLREIQIRIADSGCGIAEADRKKVFERFFRCDGSRNLPGNGLGLALVKALVKAHGGRLEVQSAPGAGSTFSVLLPRPEA